MHIAQNWRITSEEITESVLLLLQQAVVTKLVDAQKTHFQAFSERLALNPEVRFRCCPLTWLLVVS